MLSAHTGTTDPSTKVQAACGKPSVVIVGGGFCGTALATNLLRNARRPLQIVLLEPRPLLGRGVAYGTDDPRHLLNVPAANMSALAAEPNHFLGWLGQHSGVLGPFVEAEEGAFAPRYVYGRYLQDTLEASVKGAASGVTFASVQGEARALEPGSGGLSVYLTKGQVLSANAVVLALGNLPPRALPNVSTASARAGRYRADPWQGALEGLEADDDLLVVGTGLTMVDLVVSLRSRGHRGRVHALSRRGLLPQAHLPGCRPGMHGGPEPRQLVAELEHDPPRTVAELLRQVRAATEAHARRGGAWQEVVDSLRPVTPLLWRSLEDADRLRYLARVRPYWEAHRHRIAPQVADVLRVCQRAGHLSVMAGRLQGLEPTEAGVTVKVSTRGGQRTLHVARVINATGPETDLRRTSHPLLRSLLAAGHVQPDATGLGLRIGVSGQVQGTQPLPLYALGALRRNESYEGTAVPELREQAQALAQSLLEKLTPHTGAPGLHVSASV